MTNVPDESPSSLSCEGFTPSSILPLKGEDAATLLYPSTPSICKGGTRSICKGGTRLLTLALQKVNAAHATVIFGSTSLAQRCIPPTRFFTRV
jgi:hypothetical protein